MRRCIYRNVICNIRMTEFISKWQDSELHRFELDRMKEMGIDKNQRKFLATTGLPKEAAPFLSFETEMSLMTMSEIYEIPGNGNDDRIQIGLDGAGDALCIDLEDRNFVVVCDHEMDFDPCYVNSSVEDLFKFLTVMKEFEERLIAKKGPDAYLDCDFTDKEHKDLTQKMALIDPDAISEGVFWKEELDRLLADRAHYRSEK